MNEAARGVTPARTPVKFTERQLRNFWRKVDKDGPLPDQSTPHYAGLDRCWVWTGYRNRKGYGTLLRERKTLLSHRASWQIAGNIIPAKSCVLHRCDNPACVRPDHLYLGDNTDNVLDRERKGRGNQPSGMRHGRHTSPESNPRGEGNGRAKLSTDEVKRIRARYASGGVSQQALAGEFGVSQLLISKIIRRALWAHVP